MPTQYNMPTILQLLVQSHIVDTTMEKTGHFHKFPGMKVNSLRETERVTIFDNNDA